MGALLFLNWGEKVADSEVVRHLRPRLTGLVAEHVSLVIEYQELTRVDSPFPDLSVILAAVLPCAAAVERFHIICLGNSRRECYAFRAGYICGFHMFGMQAVQFRALKKKSGAAWYVQVNGRLKRRIRGFSSETEARGWIRSKSAQWLANQDQDLRLDQRRLLRGARMADAHLDKRSHSPGQTAALRSRAVVMCRQIKF